MDETVFRPDLARLFRVMESVVGTDETLTRDFLHMPAGTPYGEAASWFRRAHAELDAVEPCVVEIRTKGLIWEGRTRLHCRKVDIYRDALLADGKERSEFLGHTIVGVAWVSGRGEVFCHPNESLSKRRGRIRLQGVLNGVHVNL